MLGVRIRKIVKDDDLQIESVIRSVFHELNIPLIGTAYEDPETSSMYEAYSMPRSIYFVAEYNGKVIGGAGIRPLNGSLENICELQKMYGLPIMRGKGIGLDLLENCLKSAKSFNFNKCYLETIPSLIRAIKLYESNGFDTLSSPLGNTGHNNCKIWMTKDLK